MRLKDISISTKVRLCKTVVTLTVRYSCETWILNKRKGRIENGKEKFKIRLQWTQMGKGWNKNKRQTDITL